MIHEQPNSGNGLSRFFWEAVGADPSPCTYTEMEAVIKRSLQEAFHRRVMSQGFSVGQRYHSSLNI